MGWKKDIKDDLKWVKEKTGEISERTSLTEQKVKGFVDITFEDHKKVEDVFRVENNEWHKEADRKLSQCPKENQIDKNEYRLEEVEKVATKNQVWTYIIATFIFLGFGATITFLFKILGHLLNIK